MRALLVDMKKAHPGQDDALKTCWQTLLKMASAAGGCVGCAAAPGPPP